MSHLAPGINKYERFQDILRDYGRLITKICYYFATSKAEFDDLRQETLINIWKGLDTLKYPDVFTTWVYRVCFNSCVSYNRKILARRVELPIESIADIEDFDSFDINSYNEMHRLIGMLGAEDKTIILLWLDEKSYDEISEITGLSRTNIGVRLMRIKERLKKLSNQ